MTNRHERRKARALKLEQVDIPADQLTGRICAWEGCQQRFSGEMPDGWRNLLLFWAARPVERIADIPRSTWDRDATLCPDHARQLDHLLKPLGRALEGSTAGSA